MEKPNVTLQDFVEKAIERSKAKRQIERERRDMSSKKSPKESSKESSKKPSKKRTRQPDTLEGFIAQQVMNGIHVGNPSPEARERLAEITRNATQEAIENACYGFMLAPILGKENMGGFLEYLFGGGSGTKVWIYESDE
jgi:hypothetical protein